MNGDEKNHGRRFTTRKQEKDTTFSICLFLWKYDHRSDDSSDKSRTMFESIYTGSSSSYPLASLIFFQNQCLMKSSFGKNLLFFDFAMKDKASVQYDAIFVLNDIDCHDQ